MVDAEGKPQAVSVRTGVTDGAFTEIVSGELAEGAAVIVGGGPKPSAQAASGAPAPGVAPARQPRLF